MKKVGILGKNCQKRPFYIKLVPALSFCSEFLINHMQKVFRQTIEQKDRFQRVGGLEKSAQYENSSNFWKIVKNINFV